MTTALRMGKKAFSATVVAATIAWSIGLSTLVAPLTAAAATATGDLVKGSLPAVYYVGSDGKRYVFPNQKTYNTWYANFSAVKVISDTELASLAIGGNVTYKPGVKMIKIQSDPKTYAVDMGGSLRWITSEAVATALYGATWNQMIDDVSDAFFTNYKSGADLTAAAQFAPATVTAAATSISADKALSSTPVGTTGSVALSAMNPAASTIISDGSAAVAGSQANISVLKFDVSSSGGTLNTLRFKRLGISSDSDVDNAYLWDGSTLVGEMSSMSGGVITFSNLNMAVSGTKMLALSFDLNRDSSSGKTIGFGIQAATDVVFAAGNASGTFPINGNLMTVATVTDLGRIQAAIVSNSATVDPATTNFEAMRFTLTGSNQNLTVSSLRMKMLGSINAADLTNMKLYDGVTQLGTTQMTLGSGNYVNFDLSASPLSLTNGAAKTLSFRLDLLNGSTRTVQFSFQKAYDLKVMDAQYGVEVRPDTGTIGTFSVLNSTSTTVNAGSLTVNLSTDAPTGNVTLNATNVKIGKWDLKAIGEGIKVSSLTFQPSSDSFAGATAWTNIRNVRLVFNGTQVGTTQTTVVEETATSVTTNFTVNAGSTGILEAYADIASASGAADAIVNADNVRIRLNTGSSNAQRSSSLGTINVPGSNINANQLTVSSSASAVTASKNSSFGAPTVVKSTTQVRLASVLLTSTAGEAVDMSSVIFRDRNNAASAAGTQSLGAAFTNLTLKQGTTQVAPVVTTNTSDAAATTYTFNFSQSVRVNPNQSVQLDLYGDVLSNASWTGTTSSDADIIQMSSGTGTGATTATSVTVSAVALQPIIVATAGTLTLAIDASTPIAAQLAMGSTGVTLGSYKFSASNVENLTVSRVDVTNTNANGSGNVQNLSLWVGGQRVSSIVPALDSSNKVRFDGLTIVVPKASQTIVSVKGDTTSFGDGATAGQQVVMRVSLPSTITGVTADTVVALGASGQFPTVTSTNADANAQFPYRTLLTSTLACSGSCSSRTRAASDIVGKLTLTGSAAQDAQLRPALQANDEATTDWAEVDAGSVIAISTSTTKIDGTNSISTTVTNNAGGDELAANQGVTVSLGSDADATNYSRVSFWIQSSIATTAATDLKWFVNDAANLTSVVDETNVGSLTAATWTYVTGTLSTTTGTNSFFGLRFNRVEWGGGPVVLIDNIRFHNDMIQLDVAGSLNSTAPVGTAFTLRDAGGTTRGLGYYTGTSATGTVSIIMGDDIGNATASAPTAGLVSVGATPSVYDIVTSSTALMATDTTATETLAVSITLGTSASAGGFRWWDQAVSAASPITWVNPAPGAPSPISVSMGY